MAEVGQRIDQDRLTALLKQMECIESGDTGIEHVDIVRPGQPAKLGVNAAAEAVVPVQFIAETNNMAGSHRLRPQGGALAAVEYMHGADQTGIMGANDMTDFYWVVLIINR